MEPSSVSRAVSSAVNAVDSPRRDIAGISRLEQYGFFTATRSISEVICDDLEALRRKGHTTLSRSDDGVEHFREVSAELSLLAKYFSRPSWYERLVLRRRSRMISEIPALLERLSFQLTASRLACAEARRAHELYTHFKEFGPDIRLGTGDWDPAKKADVARLQDLANKYEGLNTSFLCKLRAAHRTSVELQVLVSSITAGVEYEMRPEGLYPDSSLACDGETSWHASDGSPTTLHE